jgi:lipid-binding SYLF domain-containing protein
MNSLLPNATRGCLSKLARCGSLILLLAPAPVFAVKAEAKRTEIREMRDAVLAELHHRSPGTDRKLAAAVGYAVFSNVGVNLLAVSTASGRGIVVNNAARGDRQEVFMRMGSVGVGFGFGVKDFRAVFIFYDQAKLDDFIARGWNFTGQVDAAVKSDEKGRSLAEAANLGAGVEVIQLTKSGIALQATLQGTKYWYDKKLN